MVPELHGRELELLLCQNIGFFQSKQDGDLQHVIELRVIFRCYHAVLLCLKQSRL